LVEDLKVDANEGGAAGVVEDGGEIFEFEVRGDGHGGGEALLPGAVVEYRCKKFVAGLGVYEGKLKAMEW
jgi:hypothetical protein